MTQLCELVAGSGPFDLVDSDEYVEGAVGGLDARILKRLRRGDYAFQAYLDLHGLTRSEAREELEAFVEGSRRKGHRCVLVVHGRGLHSKDNIPVLKESVQLWLSAPILSQSVLVSCVQLSFSVPRRLTEKAILSRPALQASGAIRSALVLNAAQVEDSAPAVAQIFSLYWAHTPVAVFAAEPDADGAVPAALPVWPCLHAVTAESDRTATARARVNTDRRQNMRSFRPVATGPGRAPRSSTPAPRSLQGAGRRLLDREVLRDRGRVAGELRHARCAE